MEEFRFPFPGRELADKELTYDPCYGKIPEADRAPIIEKAWQKGCRAAEMVYARENGSMDFDTIVRNSGLTLTEVPKDYIVGKQRYFSDYISGQKQVNLYTGSIRKWAEQNGLDYETAVNLILGHEYYHYLEVNEIGLASREYLVPMVVMGPIKLGKTGIRALSEVGAHAFVRKYFELVKEKERQNEAAEL
jgi:hypothetical protein